VWLHRSPNPQAPEKVKRDGAFYGCSAGYSQKPDFEIQKLTFVVQLNHKLYALGSFVLFLYNLVVEGNEFDSCRSEKNEWHQLRVRPKQAMWYSVQMDLHPNVPRPWHPSPSGFQGRTAASTTMIYKNQFSKPCMHYGQ
jgi:hypothetical protein